MSKYTIYREAWDKQEREQYLKNEENRHNALKCVNLLRDILVRQFRVKKIILFGSILVEGRFHEQSDIDMAVEGLPGDEYFAALGALLKASNWNVDLKPIEDMTNLMREKILQGKVIYEQG